MDISNRSLREIFTARVFAFLAETGMPSWVFGLRAVGNNKFWADYLGGKPIKMSTVDRVEAFMKAERARLAASDNQKEAA